MAESIREKRSKPDQLNIRLGSAYIHRFNTYMHQYGGKKVDFIRGALDYWMSADGQDPTAHIAETEAELARTRERLSETQKYCDERIADLNRIILEKDERIALLQSVLNDLKQGGISGRQAEVFAEDNPEYQR